MKPITPELFWLACTTAMTSIFWMPYILNRIVERGLFKALWDPHGDTTTASPWADRMMRAHKNAVENLCVFAPLVLVLHVCNIHTAATATAAATYFFARLGHMIVFTLGMPIIRVVLFLAGFGCQAALAIAFFQSA